MNETTFTYNELKILALMAALMVSGKVKVTVPELMQGYEKDRENVAVLDRELSRAVQVLKIVHVFSQTRSKRIKPSN